MPPEARDTSIPADWDRSGLPGWCYHSPALAALEVERLFRTHWQIACHVSDLPRTGDFLALDLLGERALILHTPDGIRAFHNICRHRGSRVVAEARGHCPGALVCPFHGWVYNLDGTLRGPAQPRSFPPLDKHQFALAPIETELWMGFVFLRFRPGPQPSVAELLAPMAAELAPYAPETMVPTAGPWTQTSPVNWKSVRDVDNEGYHVAMAHPALQDLYGPTYYDEPFVAGLSRSFATCQPERTRRWSTRHYARISPVNPHLPDSHRRAWVYWSIFPNAVIAATPETLQFYQEFPCGPGETLLRGAVYRYPAETREQAAARYLAMRIDRDTMAEDVQLTVWSNEAMLSPAFAGFHLSDLEYGVRTHHDHLRAVLPVMRLAENPGEDRVAEVNAGLTA